MADRERVHELLLESMGESLAEYADDDTELLDEPDRAAVLFVRAWVETAGLTPWAGEGASSPDRDEDEDFPGVVMAMIAQLRGRVPTAQVKEVDTAMTWATRAAVMLTDVPRNVTDRELLQSLVGCYAAILDPSLRDIEKY